MLIDGTVYFDRQKDIAGRAALEQERKALTEKTKNATPRRPGRPPTSPETTPGATGTPGTPGASEEVRR